MSTSMISRHQAMQKHKLVRILQMQGQEFTFERHLKDEFDQPVSDTVFVLNVLGLFHETTSYLNQVVEEGSSVRRKPSPMILCLLDESKGVEIGDITIFNGKRYVVRELKNVSEMSFAIDISLEEVQSDASIPV